MTATALLAQLNALGLFVELAPDGEHLDVGPAGRLTTDLLTVLRQHKPALIELLASQNGVGEAAPQRSAAPRWSPDYFADWVQRPDSAGRMAWEAPGLPEPSRWWARATFDELPEPRLLFALAALSKATRN